MKALHPLRVHLHQISFRKVADLLLQQGKRSARIAGARPYDKSMRQRVVTQLIQCCAETGLLLELRECFIRGDQIDGRNVGALPDEASKAFGLADCEVQLQVDRKIERVIPTATDRLGVLDDHIDGSRECQRDTDDQNNHEAGKWLSGKSPQSTKRHTCVASEPDRESA